MAAAAMADTTEIRLTRLESDVAHIRADVADLKTDIRGLRDELRVEFAGIRKDFAGLHTGLAATSQAILRGDLMNRIWTLLMCAAMLGVVARGLHWL